MATTDAIAYTTAAANSADITLLEADLPATFALYQRVGQMEERACVSFWMKNSYGSNYNHLVDQDGEYVKLSQTKRNYTIRWPGVYQLRKGVTAGDIGVTMHTPA